MTARAVTSIVVARALIIYIDHIAQTGHDEKLMPRKHPGKIAGSDVLRHCERWPTNIVWPAPIDMRLSALVQLAIAAGEQDSLTRSELLAALVLSAPADGERLREMLLHYRKARAADARTAGKRTATRDGNVIVLEERKPGRRAR
jgi:hypothetical protein